MTERITGSSPAPRPATTTNAAPAPAAPLASPPSAAQDSLDASTAARHERTTGRSAAPARKPEAATTSTALPPGVVKRGVSSFNAGKEAGKLYAAMNGGVTGLGTDEAAIHATLRNVPPEHVPALRRAYADRYPGRSLDADLKSELSGLDLARAQAALAGKRDEADAIGLEQALGGIRPNSAEVFSILEGRSPEHLRGVGEHFRQRTSRGLSETLDRELSSADAARAKALVAADPARATAVRLHEAMKGLGTDEQAVHDVLAGVDAGNRRAVESAYQQTFGRPLRGDLARELTGPDLHLATALLDNDRASAAAARVRLATAGLGTDEAAVMRAFDGTSPAEREKARRVYQARYGERLDDALRGDLDGRELQEARTVARAGALTDVQRIERAVRGVGTDEGELRAVLQKKTAAEVAALDAQYQARNGGRSLRALVQEETSGRDQFDLEMALRGSVDVSTAEGLVEAAARARQTRDFERAGIGNALGRALTAFGSTGDVVDASTARVEHALARARTDGSPIDAAEAERVRTLLEYQRDDVTHYQAAKDTAAEAASTGAAIIAGVAATAATGGAAAPLILAAGAGAGASTKVVVGAAVRGDFREDAVAQSARSGAVDGLASAVTGLAARGIGTAVKSTMATSESAAARIGLAKATTTAGTEAAPRGFVGATIERGLTNAGRGGVAGSTSGATSAALDPTTWQGGATAAVATIATKAIQGAQTGVVGGLDPTAALASTTMGRLAPRIDQVTGAALSKVGVDVKTATEATGATGVVRQATVSFAVQAPKQTLEGVAAASISTLLLGDIDAVVPTTVETVATTTTASAKEAAVSTTRRTIERLRR